MNKVANGIRTSSVTQRLSVIEGMYPSVSCNHTMRAGGGQLNQLIKKEAFEKREKKRQLKTLITLAEDMLFFLEVTGVGKATSSASRVQSKALGRTSILEGFFSKSGNEGIQQLLLMRK